MDLDLVFLLHSQNREIAMTSNESHELHSNWCFLFIRFNLFVLLPFEYWMVAKCAPSFVRMNSWMKENKIEKTWIRYNNIVISTTTKIKVFFLCSMLIKLHAHMTRIYHMLCHYQYTLTSQVHSNAGGQTRISFLHQLTHTHTKDYRIKWNTRNISTGQLCKKRRKI